MRLSILEVPVLALAPGLLALWQAIVGYVEFRANDGNGDEIVIATILSFRSKSKLSKQEIKQEIVRKARHALKRAAAAT